MARAKKLQLHEVCTLRKSHSRGIVLVGVLDKSASSSLGNDSLPPLLSPKSVSKSRSANITRSVSTNIMLNTLPYLLSYHK
jgi:hypothetical protein